MAYGHQSHSYYLHCGPVSFVGRFDSRPPGLSQEGGGNSVGTSATNELLHTENIRLNLEGKQFTHTDDVPIGIYLGPAFPDVFSSRNGSW